MRIRIAIPICTLFCLLTACSQSKTHHPKSRQEVPAQQSAPASSSKPNPHHTETRQHITLKELRHHVESGSAVIIDARSPEIFAEGHVRDALNIPAEGVETHAEQPLRRLDLDQLLIIYCESPTCNESDLVYDHLETRGYFNMRIFTPGWETLAGAKDLQ